MANSHFGPEGIGDWTLRECGGDQSLEQGVPKGRYLPGTVGEVSWHAEIFECGRHREGCAESELVQWNWNVGSVEREAAQQQR